MQSVKFENGKLYVLNQAALPEKEDYKELVSYKDAGFAITDMIVRGASLTAAVIAYGMVLACAQARTADPEVFREDVYAAIDFFAKTRILSPLSTNLLESFRTIVQNEFSADAIKNSVKAEADKLVSMERDICRSISDKCAGLVTDNDSVLTYSNYGSLSSSAGGTVVQALCDGARTRSNVKIFCAETRPYLQGARLSAWEFKKNGIDVSVITDNSAAYLMKTGKITKIITGADRIAANGDIIAKIGTCMLAVCARAFNVPFYVAAPSYLADRNLLSGADAVIESRPVEEVARFLDRVIVPEGIKILNPVFDVTGAADVTALITEKGIEKNPATSGISAVI